MQNTFQMSLDAELEWMDEAGIISYKKNDNGSISIENRFIDNAMFNNNLKSISPNSGEIDLSKKGASIYNCQSPSIDYVF